MREKILVLQVLIIVTLLKSNNGQNSYVNTGMLLSMICFLQSTIEIIIAAMNIHNSDEKQTKSGPVRLPTANIKILFNMFYNSGVFTKKYLRS